MFELTISNNIVLLMNMFELTTPEEMSRTLAEKVKQKRLSLGLKQKTLAEKAGVSLPSLRRFETKGLISLSSLLKISLVLGCLSEFNTLFELDEINSLKDLEKGEKKKKRGHK